MILGGGIAIAELDLETVVAVDVVVGLFALVVAVELELALGSTYNLSVDRTVGVC